MAGHVLLVVFQGVILPFRHILLSKGGAFFFRAAYEAILVAKLQMGISPPPFCSWCFRY
jgi:hypothetical protein